MYVREEVGGLVVGGYERNPDPWHVHDPIPPDFNHRLLPEKWERFEAIADGAFRLIPALQTTEINRFINGPEAFTPDDDFILGETEVAGFFVAAGFCAHGVTGAAGIGRWTAEWIVEGEPSMDLSKMDVRRFGRQYASRDYSRRRTRSTRSTTTSGTRARSSSPAGRCGPRRPTVGSRRWTRSSARRPAGSAPTGSGRTRTRRTRTGGREGGRASSGRPRSWRSTSRPGNERRCRRDELREDRSLGARRPGTAAAAVRERRGREGRPHRVHADAEPPRGIESDLTVTRLDVDRFRLVIGTAFGSRDLAWIHRHRDGADVRVRDVTSSLGCLGIWGPAARDVLSSVCDHDLSNDAFPYLTARDLAVGEVPCLAARVTYG